VKLTLYKYKLSIICPKRKLCDEDTEFELICDTEDSESDETDDDDDDNDDDEQQPSSVMQKQQVMKWGLWSHANHRHAHCLQAVIEERRRMKHLI
jgi:hypothetical protein